MVQPGFGHIVGKFALLAEPKSLKGCISYE